MIEVIEGRVIAPSGLDTLVNKIFNLDIFALCDLIPDGSVDFILCDLPYEVTRNEWDKTIILNDMWLNFNRILNPKGTIALTAMHRFYISLYTSNPDQFRYEWVWSKGRKSGFLNAKKRPLIKHEMIMIFDKGNGVYNPQMGKGDRKQAKRTKQTSNYGKIGDNIYDSVDRYPESILEFSIPDIEKGYHPTQKPISLFEYLIRTYTNSGDLVFDPCVGSGTTAIAARNTGRRFIVGDSSLEYCQIAQDRLRLPFEASQIKKSSDLGELPLFAGLNIDNNI